MYPTPFQSAKETQKNETMKTKKGKTQEHRECSLYHFDIQSEKKTNQSGLSLPDTKRQNKDASIDAPD